MSAMQPFHATNVLSDTINTYRYQNRIYRESYMSADVLLNLLNELGEK